MAITQTTLSADLSADGLTMRVGSGTGFPTAGAAPVTPGYPVRIDKELFFAVQQPVSGVIKLRGRGSNGTAARSHDILSKVSVSSDPADFADPSAGNDTSLPPYMPTQQTIGEDYTFTAAEIAAYGNQPRVFVITKATAAAITLVAPSKSQDGLVMQFTSLTDAAHVITATTLINDGASGAPEDTATFAAFAGATITLMAQSGLWNMVSATAVTIT